MKKFTLLFISILITGMAFSQTMVNKRTRDFVKTIGDVQSDRELTVIWEDDFSDDALWVTVYSEDPNDGPWVIGTEAPSGYYSEGMGAIESTSAANGFAMYDSDANGTTAGSQDSKLIYHTSIDCSSYSKIAIQFESYYRMFNGNCYVEVSTDSVTWEQYQVHTDVETNGASANPTLVNVNITGVAANQATVYFRFRYIGEWDYAWMVDDVKFVEAPDHDLNLVDARVNFFLYPQYVDPEEYPMSEYYNYSGFVGKYPLSQISSDYATMVFNGVVQNYGSLDATPSLSITVNDPSDAELFTNSATFDGTLAAQEMDSIDIVDVEYTIDAPELGDYDFVFETYEDSVTDENPGDNSVTYTTEITQDAYARDMDQWTGSWSTSNYQGGGQDGDMVGVIYQLFNTDTIHNVQVFISDMTAVNTSFVVKLITFNEEWTEITSSQLETIDSEDDVGKWYSIGFPVEQLFEVGTDEMVEVMAAVEYYPAGEEFRLGIDGTVPTSGHETFMYFVSEDTWYYYGGSHVPLIRMNDPGVASAVGDNAFDNVKIYPNPTNGVLNIKAVAGANIEVFNMLGKCVRHIDNAEMYHTVDISNLAEGTYFVRVQSDDKVLTRKVNLIK